MKITNLTVIFMFLIGNLYAQQSLRNQDFPNTVEGQFQKLYHKSNNYQVFKVMRKDQYLILQKNILDSISTLKKDITAKQQTINSQQETVTTLENKITNLNSDLSSAIDKENSISLFGLQLSKVGYNTLLWSIITALLVSLAIFIIRFKNSNLLTREAKNTLTEVEQDFEQHRKKSLEKEQKLRRQLQDEINKQRGV